MAVRRVRRLGERGMIFTLDATLAILIVMLIMAGLAQPSILSFSKSYGNLRLHRLANDALTVMDQAGITEGIIELLNNNQYTRAETAARENLLMMLPPEIKFKYVIGKEENILLQVYPDNVQDWDQQFSTAKEVMVALHVTPEFIRVTENLDVLIWADDADDQWFAQRVIKPGWTYRITDNEELFVAYLENTIESDWYPDVVFMPDVSVSWADSTIQTLDDYLRFKIISNGNEIGGGGVAGGETFWVNRRDPFRRFFGIPIWFSAYGYMLILFGIDPNWPNNLPNITPLIGSEYSLSENNMWLVNLTHYITTVFSPSENEIPYAGDLYHQYKYELWGLLNPWLSTLGQWIVDDNIWSGLVTRDPIISLSSPWFGITFRLWERTVLFNTRLAQSAHHQFNIGDIAGANKWILLAQRAITWASRQNPELQPIVLYLWRD